MGLSSPILKVLPELGLITPTQIQTEAIPVLLSHKRDFIGLAQTGTGKTAAFVLPILDGTDPSIRTPQALVLAPTRELGQQIAVSIDELSKYLPELSSVAVYGGANISAQIKSIKRGCHIVIATPGRLVDLIKRKAINLDALNTVVLDEADEMLNMGFKEELDFILSVLPEDRATWLFSATMPQAIRNIVKHYMDDPFEVRVDANTVNNNIEHQYVLVKASQKAMAIRRVLDAEEPRGVLFCRTKIEVQNMADELARDGYKADAIHGDLTQQQRDKVMASFKAGKLHLLVATDVAARGIDVNDLTHVFHCNLPDDPAYYTHRSGRTARAGKKGISLVLASRREEDRVRRYSKLLKINFTRVSLPEANDIARIRLARWATALLDTKSTDKREIVAEIEESFKEIDKSELINKLVAVELQKLNLSDELIEEKSEKRGERKEKVNKENEFNYVTLQVNMGSDDYLTKRDMLTFMREDCGCKSTDIGNISLNKSNTVFQCAEEVAEQVIAAFQQIDHDGRKVKVSKVPSRNGGGKGKQGKPKKYADKGKTNRYSDKGKRTKKWAK